MPGFAVVAEPNNACRGVVISLNNYKTLNNEEIELALAA